MNRKKTLNGGPTVNSIAGSCNHGIATATEYTETNLQAESDAGMHVVDGRLVFRLTEADADIAAGRIHRFPSVDEMLASLKRPLR